MSNVDFLLPLLVAVPMLLSTVPIVLGLRFDRTGWSVAALTTTALVAATTALANAVYATGPVSHKLGGWNPAYGIELVLDEFSALIAVLVAVTAAGVLAYTRVGGPRGNTFYSGYLLLTGGLLGISVTGDVFNLFVFLEIVGLATYAMIASGDGPESAVAALKYLILGTVGASMYLIGVGLIFMATGTLNMGVLAEVLPAAVERDPTLVRAGFAFIFVGFSMKVAQWPLHTWQPDAYQHAPDGVTPVIAAVVSTAYAYAFGRLLYSVFGPEFLTSTPYLTELVVTVGCVSVVAGSVLAVIQTDVKRMFAFSSVSQFGLIVAAYGLVTESAFVGATIHLVGHAVIKAGLFAAAGVIAISYDARTVDEYAGLADEHPLVAGMMALLLISLIGIPPSAGFVGKWYIALGAVEAQLWPVAIVVLFSTLMTLAYSARLLEKMYFTPATPLEAPHAPESVATDGGEDGGDTETAAGADAANDGAAGTRGGTETAALDAITANGDRNTVSYGMLALVVAAALLAISLGFAGGFLAGLLDPSFITEVFN
ncbi:proton-conducting transporter transmembrane domain-containing protein [Natrialba asiatica]|uniref:NADH/ubiquinone/plastoquinone n=1 Tax=Natrialba asiatica (strain ATCC 700177 / DSM 12278 / JCM 9576 / FERM P-10747 / NBRC 102637 / 172P1) TaxID=29540 RepID=M0AQJ5_NATA1|nr:proton-conducting transporter membrane subunit [Natrialba asiatica]ELZ00820.1 NADH/ubiquinone/plastoquinone [Natrialba asiatica DSM 12278]